MLDFQIPRLDIEADELPENLIVALPDLSPELRDYLVRVFIGAGGKTTASPGAVSGIVSNAKLPHFSIHLRNVTVREALNAVAAQSFLLYRATATDPRLVHAPDDLRVSPAGWEYKFRAPNDMPFQTWVRSMFGPLE